MTEVQDQQGTERPIWDKAGMLERLMDDPNLVKEILMVYLGDLPKQLQALQDFVKAGNIPAAERQAHQIKGATSLVGGEQLRVAAFEMEKTFKAGDFTNAQALTVDLIRRFEQLREELTEYIK